MNAIPDLDVFEMLAAMGISADPASGGAEAKFSCPLHGLDERPSAYMNVDTTLWICHSCKARGNAVSLAARVYGVTYSQAATWLRDAYGVDFREPDGGSMAVETERRFSPDPETSELVRPSASWQESFVGGLLSDNGSSAYEYARSRGFTAKTISEWGFGFDAITGRLTLPVYDLDSELVGFKARSFDGAEPKYLILGDRREPCYGFHPYESSEHVFGLDRNRLTNRVVLTEGELDAVALMQAGVERAVAVGMSYFSDRHARLLIQEAASVTVFFDTDTAGEGGTWGSMGAGGNILPGVVQKLEPFVSINIVEPHDRDPAKMVQDGDDALVLGLVAEARSSIALASISE